ncbi:MAG: hypothetical protein ABSE82_16400 [Nitrososphaerales archaeon]|jgi:HEAT repeat protein
MESNEPKHDGDGPNETVEDKRLREQVGLLVRALRADLESVREVAIVQLTLLGPRAIPYLDRALSNCILEKQESSRSNSDPELAIRGITRALGIMREESAVEIIGKALPRPEAVSALAKLGNERSLDLIIPLVEAPLDYRDHRGSVLRNFAGGREPFQGNSDANREFIRGAFLAFGESGRERLRKELEQGTPSHKAAIASIVGILGYQDFVSPLRKLTDSGVTTTEDYLMKAEVAKTLLLLNARETVPSLVETLFKVEKEPDESELDREKRSELSEARSKARTALEEAILKLGDVDAWIEVGTHINPEYPAMHSEFRDAVVRSGEAALPSLTKKLGMNDKSAQSLAAKMIAEIADQAAPRRRDY